MLPKKMLAVLFSLAVFIITGSSFGFESGKQKRNLKVLPKDISDEKLDSIMSSFTEALSMECNYCHVSSKSDPNIFDYASDEKGEKEIARKMMIMTNDINRKYFHFNEKEDPDLVQAVTCNTCHRGEAHPVLK